MKRARYGLALFAFTVCVASLSCNDCNGEHVCDAYDVAIDARAQDCGIHEIGYCEVVGNTEQIYFGEIECMAWYDCIDALEKDLVPCDILATIDYETCATYDD